MPTTYHFSLKKHFGLSNVQVFDFPESAESSPRPTYNLPREKETNHMATGRKNDNLLTPLGTVVFADLILSNGKLGADEQTIQLLSALVSVDQSKIIERTSVRGRNGTVKEYWSMDDFSVRLQGAIIDPRPDFYPEQEVKQLANLLALPQSLQVVSRYLQQFGIYELVVKDYFFEAIGTKTNTQFFEVLCYSDEPAELILKYEV